MPLVDMPVEALKQYQGRNPKPTDFDEFWDKALAELDTFDPNPEFIPVDMPVFCAECYDLFFTGTKGAKIHARFMKPKSIDGKVPAVLFFHGLGCAVDTWERMIAYASQGFCVAALECRGQTGLSEDVGGHTGTTFPATMFIRGIDGDPHDMLMRDQYLDTALLARIVMGLPYVDETRVGATGHSQGGGLTVACSALVPEIKLAYPVYPYLSDYKRVWEMDLAKNAFDGIRHYFRNYDPRHEREDEFFTKLGYIDVQYLAPRIRAKLRMATGLMDTVVPPSTQFAMYNKLTCEKDVHIYPDYGHETMAGLHDDAFAFFAEL